MTTPGFPLHTASDAPERSRAIRAGAARRFGYLPSPLALHASSPAVLEAFGQLVARFERCSLGATEREVVTMTIAADNGCDYCVAMHTRTLGAMQADPALVAALRDDRPLADARLATLRVFTRAVMAGRGAVPDAAREAFFAAGFTAENALDVVLGVATYTLSTYANRLTDAPLDPALEPYRWSPTAHGVSTP